MRYRILVALVSLILISGIGSGADNSWTSDFDSNWNFEWEDDFELNHKWDDDFDSDWDMGFEDIEFEKKSSDKDKSETKKSETKKTDEKKVEDKKPVKKNKSKEKVYWQVDFGEGDVPIPPSYYPKDLMAALGDSNGVNENPSLLRQDSDGQLKDVEIESNQFEIDQESPTTATVTFTVEESASERTLHLASFEMPGPFDPDEIDQQELYDSEVRTFEGGETGEMTVELPQ